jgi:CubicO group peptidase (beta-lactamase class C family)
VTERGPTYFPSPAICQILLILMVLAAHPAMAGVKEAAAYSSKTGGKSLIIWKDYRMLHEDYRRGGGRNEPENLYSMTKTVCALGMVAAAGSKGVKFDEPASRVLTSWKKDARKREITVRELLSQTSGLSPGFEALYAKGVRNKNTADLHLPAINPPGKVFAYGPSHYESLEALFDARLSGGPDAPLAMVDGAVLRPLGITRGSWRHDRAGNPYFSAGAFLSPDDMLKIGRLVLRNGWSWIFPIVSSNGIREMKQGSRANAMYGMGFWLNANAAKSGAQERDVEEAITAGLGSGEWARSCMSRKAPPDLIAMVGSYGQRVYIVPSRRMVVVRFGEGRGFRDPEFLGRLFSEASR